VVYNIPWALPGKVWVKIAVFRSLGTVFAINKKEGGNALTPEQAMR